MCCRDRLWGRGVAAFTAFLRTRLAWSFASNLISISHHWGGSRPHNLAELQCPCGPKGMLLVWLQMGQSWTLSGSRNADSRVEILIENRAVKLACLNIMKWLRVFEMFIGCYICQAGGKTQVQTIQRMTKNKEIQSDPSGTCSGGQASNHSLQLDILSLWNPLANMFLGMIPDLIFWQEGGLRAPIRCYLDSILPGRSGLFTPPEAWLSRPAHLQPEGAEVRHMLENRGQGA